LARLVPRAALGRCPALRAAPCCFLRLPLGSVDWRRRSARCQSRSSIAVPIWAHHRKSPKPFAAAVCSAML
jgi:hypothetical protein